MPVTVTPDEYIRAEVDGRLAVFQERAGGVNAFYLIARPVPTDEQPVVRMNRDTLYGGGVVDTGSGARVFVPESPDGRYVSLFVIDNDHYVVDVFHQQGWHDLASDTRYCCVIPRVELRDRTNEDEVAHVTEVLRRFAIDAASAEPFAPPEWDWESMLALRAQYETEFRTYTQYPSGWMGRRGETDESARHLGVAGAWGLFPETEAVYINYTGPADATRPYVATYQVPEYDAFWSIAVYGDDAFFHSDNATLSSATTTLNDDATFTVYFGSAEQLGDMPNRVDISDGWSMLFRVYQPGASVLERRYVLPAVTPYPG